jgi:hypothetical protein
MRRETSENQQHAYGARTRVEVHRSRYELEDVLHRYGADEVLFVEADANASIQFEMHGRYVQLALPLPDPQDVRFTHTPSGRPRAATAQERAYEQALREHWRSLIVAVRGKLQSVESGISTFEQEFDRFLVPHFAEEKKKRNRKTPKAVNWLLGGSHTAAIALVAAFLVPASAVGAFALPTNVVGHLAAPFRSELADSATAGQGGNGLALARGGWSPSSGSASAPSDARRRLALRPQRTGAGKSHLRQEASLSSPSADVPDTPAPRPTPPSDSASPVSNNAPPSPPSPPAHNDPPETLTPVERPADGGDAVPADPQAGDTADQPVPSTDPSSDGAAIFEPPADDPSPTDQPADPGAPPSTDPGTSTAPGNGNGNGNGNANGQNGPQGQGNGQGNGNGNANGQNGTQGQGNGQRKGGK